MAILEKLKTKRKVTGSSGKSSEPKKRKANGNGKEDHHHEASTGYTLREDCFRVLSEDNTIPPKDDLGLSKDQVLGFYRNMSRTRALDERGMMLQRQGRIGFYLPSYGQEAIQTGTAAAIENTDWVFSSYREQGVFLMRGASPYHMICNLYGNADDLCKGRQMPVHYSFPELKLFSVSSPIATQVIQAVGAAMAAKVRGEKTVAITYFGDGGSSENDTHTGLTFAGAYKAPTVFICTNNGYAISVPIRKQCGTQRLVEKAAGYGMPGIAVDGNDVFAVYQVTKEAVERARRGEGPTFIECVTHRMGPHSSSDDPTRYRDEKLYDWWKKRDPILLLREYLTRKKWWSDAEETRLQEALKRELIEAVEKAEAQPMPDVDTMFSDVYAELTPQLERQREALRREQDLRGKFENTSEAFPL